MLNRILSAVCIGLIAWLVVIFIGALLLAVGVTFGAFVREIAPLVGLLAGLYYFLTGRAVL